jgi:hypothetical protein
MNKGMVSIVAAGIALGSWSCTGADTAVRGLAPLYTGVECLSRYHADKGRLPVDRAELLRYAAETGIALDLSKFKTFEWKMTSDSTCSLAFEIASDVKGGGTFNFNLKHPAP